MLNVNRKQLRHSAQTKKEAANSLLQGAEVFPAPAVYLAHVALECALKLRILSKNNAQHIEDLRRRIPPKEFESLFNGATGHNLEHLEKTAGLRRYLIAQGSESLLAESGWKKMHGTRPYSVRYGYETVTVNGAKKEIEFTVKLADLILKSSV